jgi:hypothetical protein
MMKRKFWWLDTTDLTLARAKLEIVKGKQLKDWDWISWDEQDFSSPQEAELSLLREIGIPSMFSDGKAICCQGLPSFHQKVAKALPEIPDGILLIVMSSILKTTTLYLTAKKDEERYKVDEVEDISTPKTRVAFVAQRAEKIGIRLDEQCCRMLAEMCGNSHDMISNELKKLRDYSEDGTISVSDIDAACVGEGEAAMFDLSGKIVAGNKAQAHESLRRILLTFDPHALVSYLCGWARTMCLVSGCKYDVERSKLAATKLYKLEKVDDRRARRVQMYANTGRFFHACREMEESSYPPHWPLIVMAECSRLEFATRFIQDKDAFGRETHRFIDRIMDEEGAGTLRTLPLPTVVSEREDRRMTKKYEVINEIPKND